MVASTPRKTPTKNNFPLDAKLEGELVTIKEDGYGFISLGAAAPQIFVHKKNVPPQLWQKGARLSFTVMPPKKGHCWIAQDVQAAGLPSAEVTH